MPDTRIIRHQDGTSKLSDPSNFPGLVKPGGGPGATSTEANVVKIYQLALASAITAAAARSGRAR